VSAVENNNIQTPKVYDAISKVQRDIAQIGVSKDRQNKFDKYNFRGIDDVYNALAPILAEHGLCILPRVLERQCVERTSKNGGAMYFVTVDMEFDLVAAEDGSKHTIKSVGEAMDRADKATNKAMSAAYKYACFQTFCIPTEGDNDAENYSPEATTKHTETLRLEQFVAINDAKRIADCWNSLDQDTCNIVWSQLTPQQQTKINAVLSPAA